MPEIDKMHNLVNTILSYQEVIIFLGSGVSLEGKQDEKNFPRFDELIDNILGDWGFEPTKSKKKRVDNFFEVIQKWENEGKLSAELRKYLDGEPGVAHYYLAAISIALFGKSNSLLYLTTNYDDLMKKAFTDLERNPVRKFSTIALSLRPNISGSEFRNITNNIDVHLKNGYPVILKLFGDLNSQSPIFMQEKMKFQPVIENKFIEWMKKPIIFIGYTFSDKIIKELLIASRGQSPVFLINPSKKLPSEIKELDRVCHIKISFFDFTAKLLKTIQLKHPSIDRKIDKVFKFLDNIPFYLDSNSQRTNVNKCSQTSPLRDKERLAKIEVSNKGKRLITIERKEARPDFPSEIVRQILLESGHRCAVCGTGCPLEKANIIPWNKSKGNESEDLICLCANCYQRAELENWGEKTLKEYKKQPWINTQLKSTEILPKKTESLQLKIDIEMEALSSINQLWLQYALSAFLEIPPNAVKITSVSSGSSIITVSIPETSAVQLLKAYYLDDKHLYEYLDLLNRITKYKKNSQEALLEIKASKYLKALVLKEKEVKYFFNKLAKNLKNRKINFNKIPQIKIQVKDIQMCDITGDINESHLFNRCNIIQSNLFKVNAIDVNFQHIDFKDCAIKNSTFSQCNFDLGAIVNNTFFDCKFFQSHFHFITITETEFHNVTFENCDLSDMLIKSCRFYHCNFNNCKTSNKLFEMCHIVESQFTLTDLQIDTLKENFGIQKEQLNNCKIRSHATNEDFYILDMKDIESFLNGHSNLSGMEIFKISYFLNPQLKYGSKYLDGALDVNEWGHLCRIPGAFIELLEVFSDFLLYQYEKNNLMIHVIIVFHSITSMLSDQISTADQKFDSYLYRGIMGVHLSLTRIVEVYLQLLLYLTTNGLRPLHFLVRGPLVKDYYTKKFQPFFRGTNLRVVKITKHNSPNKLSILWDSIKDISIIIGCFLATRTQIEISTLKTSIPLTDEDIKINKLTLPERLIDNPNLPQKLEQKKEIFSFSMGFNPEKQHLYQMKLKSIMPGSLVLDLRLNVSTKIIGELRKIFINLLSKKDV